MAWGVGFSAGPVWVGWRLGGGRRGVVPGEAGSGPGGGLNGLGALLMALPVLAVLWAVAAVAWGAVMLCLGLSDLLFGLGRAVWRWRSGGGGRPGVLVRWAAVRWLWAQGVSRAVCWWRGVAEREAARRRSMSAEELFWERSDGMRDVAAWLMVLGAAVGLMLWLFVAVGRSAGVDRGYVWEVTGWIVGVWWGCGVAFAVGVWLLLRRGFLRAPVAETPVEPAPAAAAAGPDLRLGPRRSRRV